METRANYVLIGAFTLAGLIGLLLFFVWLARLELDRQYDYYDVLFDNVAGLSQAGEVRFNGLPVGQVVSLEVDPADASKVRVRIEVAAGTPVKADTRVRLQAQGVTGVSYVSLTGGSPDAPPLRPTAAGFPVLVAQRSVVEALSEDAPDLVANAIELIKSLQAIMGPENQGYVAGILQNLDRASGSLDTALKDFSSITGTVETAAAQVGDFTGRLQEIGASVKTTLATTDATLKAAEGAFAQAETTLASAGGAIDSAGRAFGEAETVMREQVPGIVRDLGATATTLRTAVAEIDAEARGTLGKFGAAADQASARLGQMEATIAALDRTLAEATTTLAAVDSASTSFETLVEGEGAKLIDDARKALASAETSIAAIDRFMAEDVPAIAEEVRTAVATANRVIEETGADVSGFTGSLKPLTTNAGATLDAATATFRRASATLIRLDTAMDVAVRTLTAAEATFAGANRVIDEEVAPTAADIRAAADRLATSVNDISDDLPGITEELRATMARASAAIAQIEAVVAASGPPVRDFTTTGLPQFTRFTQEARALVATLERVATRLERDPARFILGGQAPDYRR